MSNPLKSLMTDFARRIGSDDIEVPASGQIMLRVDERIDVNLVYDHTEHRIHLFSVVESLPQAIEQSQPALPDGLDQDWTCAAYERDGIDWALRWHDPTGLMLRSASAPAVQLDSVRFCALFEQFVEDLGDPCLPRT